MKKINLSILSLLATLVFFASLAYSADPQTPTTASPEPAAVVAVKPVPPEGSTETSLVNVMLNLLDSDVEYRLNESTTIILAYSPFTTQQNDVWTYQPASNISIGLKFSF